MNSFASDYDIVIIGAGMAGLYTAYKTLKNAPETRILIVERADKKHLGGRANNATFQGVTVVTGAGVGRLNKDHRLKQLMSDFGFPIHTFPAKISFPPTLDHCDVEETFNLLKREYKYKCKEKGERIHSTFKQFATNILGKSDYLNFITCVGYTDYENEDVYETLYNYGFEDNYSEWTGFSVPWHALVNKMAEFIGHKNFLSSATVESIDPYPSSSSSDVFSVSIQSRGNNYLYSTNKVVIATAADSLQTLVPINKPLYREIHGQPFLRIYGKFAKSSIPILKTHIHGMTAIPGPLQKIIPIDADKGIYMISYSDNKHAIFMRRLLENTPKNRDNISRLLEEGLGIPNGSLALLTMTDFYWDIGTHYYEPLHPPFKTRQTFIRKIQNPLPNLYVVGEAVSLHQGWVEGALESVDKIAQNL